MVVCAGIVMLTTAAYAQTTFCTKGSSALLVDSKTDASKVKADCKPGDMISIPGNSTLAIALICDFSKTIYLAPNGLATCVVGVDSENRKH
jgi:hypothetical protein